MIILIDYDNLPWSSQNDGLVSISEKILRKIKLREFAGKENVTLRLYGGWFYKKAFSKKANVLLRQITGEFPYTLSLSDKASYVVKAELATTLVSDTFNELTHTFRIRSPLKDMKVKRFPLNECAAPTKCSISVVSSFMNNLICPNNACNISPDMTFYRAEQKLVDTMLVVDLIHYSIHQKRLLIIVSGDDDMWPGIRYALMQGARIIHFIPRMHRRVRHLYKNLYTHNYTMIQL